MAVVTNELTLDAEEAEIVAEALDAYQEANRYGAGLTRGEDRKAKHRKALVADKLLRRIRTPEDLDRCRHGKTAAEHCERCDAGAREEADR